MNKRVVDNYNWDEMYDRADNFLSENNIPYKVNRTQKIVLRSGATCYVEFPMKGNKEIISKLKQFPLVIECMGSVINGVRYAKFGLIMNDALTGKHFDIEAVKKNILDMTKEWCYKNFTVEDIAVTEDEDKICFAIKGQECRLDKEYFQTAYVNNTRVDTVTAMALNTASVLDTAEFWYDNYGKYFQ